MPTKLRHAGVVLLFVSTVCSFAGPDPAAFDRDGNGRLSEYELTLYIAARDKVAVPAALVLNPDLSPKEDGAKAAAEFVLRETQFKVGEILGRAEVESGPLPIELVRHLEGFEPVIGPQIPATAPEQPPEKPLGIFGQPASFRGGSRGPILLRKSTDDWNKDLKSSTGARVAYTDNGVTDKHTWNTEGALIYPFAVSAVASPQTNGHIHSSRTTVLPSVAWKVVRANETNADDVEELQFSVPVTWSANLVGRGWLRNTKWTASPYLLTDFKLGGRLWGGSLTFKPSLLSPEGAFAVNLGYRPLGKGPLTYAIGLVPKLDFNHLDRGSRFIKRTKDDDFFRGGGKASVGLRVETDPAFEFLVSYEGYWNLSGAPAHSELLSESAKLWLNDNVAFSIDYQRGDTPVAQKAVDLFSLGTEVRF